MFAEMFDRWESDGDVSSSDCGIIQLSSLLCHYLSDFEQSTSLWLAPSLFIK